MPSSRRRRRTGHGAATTPARAAPARGRRWPAGRRARRPSSNASSDSSVTYFAIPSGARAPGGRRDTDRHNPLGWGELARAGPRHTGPTTRGIFVVRSEGPLKKWARLAAVLL